MRNIFIVSGYGAAGKSTVINNIISNIKINVISFGTIHKTAYKTAGYKCTADWLANEGYECYEETVKKMFIEEISKQSGDILIDGLFSSSCYYFLKTLELKNDSRIINIFISTPEDERISRMYKRQNFITINQAKIHTKASDFIKGTCGLYQIYDDAKYIIEGTNIPKIVNKQIEEIIRNVNKENYQNKIEEFCR